MHANTMAASSSNRGDGFWDRVAESYSRRPIADEAAYQTKLEVTRTYLRPDMRVLEFGCGTGSTAIVHAPSVRHIRAIDMSSRMVEIARGKAAIEGIDNISFEQGRIEEFTAPAGSLQAVLGMSILHLLRDKDAAIAKVFEMLEPGGVFVSSTSCMGRSWKMAPMRLVLPIARLFGRLPLVRFLTPKQLLQSMISAGFEIDHQWHASKTCLFLVARKPS